MQTANIMVALGGDRTNTVPRYSVPASEIAVLGAIHGHDAIFDVDPADDIEVSSREELARLKSEYGRARDNDGRSLVDLVYPGHNARLFDTISDLDLDESQFKALQRAQAVPVEKPAEPSKTAKSLKAANKNEPENKESVLG